MEKIELKAKARSPLSPNNLRKTGLIPAIVYGHGIKTENLEVTATEFEKVFKKAGESSILQLQVDDKGARNVIIHDAQKHYLTGKVQHVDFYEVSMTEVMTATVPLVFVGISKAVKEQAGILVQVLNEVEVECLPADLPHAIEVSIEGLNTFDDAVHVQDLKVSSKVKILAEADDVVIKVSPPRDVEKELEQQIGDVSQVEGAQEEQPAETAEEAGKEKTEKPDKEDKK